MKDERIVEFWELVKKIKGSKEIKAMIMKEICHKGEPDYPDNLKTTEKEMHIYGRYRKLQFELKKDYNSKLLNGITRSAWGEK